jgi:hypothetical protein
LVTSQAPGGIISFELAKTPAKSTSIMNSWDSTQKLIAAFSLGLDYLFILSLNDFDRVVFGLDVLIA